MGGAVGNGYTDVYMGPEFEFEGKTHARIGNMSPFAEFNIWCDPEAGQTVFGNRELAKKTTLITLDMTHQVCATKEVREMLLGEGTRLRRMFFELLMFFAETYEREFGLKEGPPLHDPLAVAVVLDSFEDDGSRWNIEVVRVGEQDGRTVLNEAKEGVFVPRKVDVKKFWDLIEYCMARADEKTGYAKLDQ